VTAEIRIKRKSREKSPGINLRLGNSFSTPLVLSIARRAPAKLVASDSRYIFTRALARFSFPSFRQRGVIARFMSRGVSHTRVLINHVTRLAGGRAGKRYFRIGFKNVVMNNCQRLSQSYRRIDCLSIRYRYTFTEILRHAVDIR